MMNKFSVNLRPKKFLAHISFVFITLVNFVGLLPPVSHAQESGATSEKVITIVNPVRGRNLWYDTNIEAITHQYEEIASRNLTATWLLQYDVLEDRELIAAIKSFSQDHEIGLFLEISEKLASRAGVPYKLASGDWARPDKVYLSGYRVYERKKLVDTVMAAFMQTFGHPPQSAGAWHVDPASLTYLADKYHLKTTIGVADQFDTDANREWGQYWGYPYYPSKYNALKPAQSLAEKLNIVKIQWALRDPLLSYGPSPYYSNFSLQANDYVSEHNLDTPYFSHLMDEYLSASNPLTQATVGLEVGQEGVRFAEEFSNQLEVIAQKKHEGVSVLTMNQFADRYQHFFPELSPPVVISGTHQAGDREPELKNSRVTWIMSPKLRARIVENGDKRYLQDLRVYPEYFPDIDLWQPQVAERIVRQLPVIVDQIGLQNQRELPRDFPDSITEEALLSFATESIYPKQNLVDTLLGYYEGLKDTAHSNLSHFVFSRLEGILYIGIKIKLDTFVGVISNRGVAIERIDPQTLAFFKSLGSLIGVLPRSPSGPARELVQYLKNAHEVQVFDHDQMNSSLFQDWHAAHPEAKRIFYNSLAEVWQLKN